LTSLPPVCPTDRLTDIEKPTIPCRRLKAADVIRKGPTISEDSPGPVPADWIDLGFDRTQPPRGGPPTPPRVCLCSRLRDLARDLESEKRIERVRPAPPHLTRRDRGLLRRRRLWLFAPLPFAIGARLSAGDLLDGGGSAERHPLACLTAAGRLLPLSPFLCSAGGYAPI
jgi:hypothetical protein